MGQKSPGKHTDLKQHICVRNCLYNNRFLIAVKCFYITVPFENLFYFFSQSDKCEYCSPHYIYTYIGGYRKTLFAFTLNSSLCKLTYLTILFEMPISAELFKYMYK